MRKDKARGREQRERTLNLFFLPQKLRCWTCCKFSYVQKGAPNVFWAVSPLDLQSPVLLYWSPLRFRWRVLDTWRMSSKGSNAALPQQHEDKQENRVLTDSPLWPSECPEQSNLLGWEQTRSSGSRAFSWGHGLRWSCCSLIDTATAMVNVTCSIIELCGAVLLFL